MAAAPARIDFRAKIANPCPASPPEAALDLQRQGGQWFAHFVQCVGPSAAGSLGAGTTHPCNPDDADGMSNPILIEVTRGALVESAHTGSVALSDARGRLLLSLGDVSRPVYPRSSVKSLQCVPLIETGAADHFGFGDEEIALACASHSGSDRHTAIALRMLERIGLGEAALGCGAHAPMGESAARALVARGERPSQLHNNCSGKHAGMLATAVHRGETVAGYWSPDHPVQRRVHAVISELSGERLDDTARGIDGCAVPTWAMPLAALARLFAALGSGEGLAPDRRRTVERIMRACWAEPDLVAGPGRADSVLMQRLPGHIFLKTGAEGVYCGAFPALGLGFALKIDDGTKRASAGAAMALIEHILPAARGLIDKRVMKNWRGMETGLNRSSAAFELALDRLRL
jgi:L-asparaginase II